jgi:hypothetical protein
LHTVESFDREWKEDEDNENNAGKEDDLRFLLEVDLLPFDFLRLLSSILFWVHDTLIRMHMGFRGCL